VALDTQKWCNVRDTLEEWSLAHEKQ
jgi:hypothetical protein